MISMHYSILESINVRAAVFIERQLYLFSWHVHNYTVFYNTLHRPYLYLNSSTESNVVRMSVRPSVLRPFVCSFARSSLTLKLRFKLKHIKSNFNQNC
jgi:hypothetical protein